MYCGRGHADQGNIRQGRERTRSVRLERPVASHGIMSVISFPGAEVSFLQSKPSVSLSEAAMPDATPQSECFHCGLPLPIGASYPVMIDGTARDMCCRGCQAVAQVIAGASLGSYYRSRTSLPESPREAQRTLVKKLRLYDDPRVQQSFVRKGAEHVKEASLILEGITCAACIWLNEQHLASLSGVLGAEINYATRRARVCWDEGRIRLSEILQAVADIGYHAYPYDSTRYDEMQRKERKTALWRLFVAGLGMMQVMMYAVPTYFAKGDMSPDIREFMRIASMVLALPVVFYSAGPFFAGALRDLKLRRVGMDVPVALGIGVAFAASIWATLDGRGEVYFDSITMFVFFLLCGRFLEMNARGKAVQEVDRLVKLIPAMAERVPEFPASREVEPVPVSSLKAGDWVLVRAGDTIPADGRVEEGASEVDEALLTGESRPVVKRRGDAIAGGAINVASPLFMRVERVGQETMLAGIVRLLDRASSEKPIVAVTADRAARWFVFAVLVIAAAAALGWYLVDPSRALWVTVSVLVVTCPCALSLATPAALTAATGTLTRLGVLVTRGHALETLAKASHFVFDKTGTLTQGRMSVLKITALAGLPEAECLALASALEQSSEHPVARALKEEARRIKAPARLPAEHVHNVLGSGIEGVMGGRRLRLGTPRFVQALHGKPFPIKPDESGVTLVALGDDCGWLGWFAISDRVRPEARELVAALARMGKQVTLLSGDRIEAAQAVATALGIETVVAGVSPAEKLDYVRRLERGGAVVAMVGDGANDAPVLGGSAVSIAMGGGTQLAQASADMILLSEHLVNLLDAVVMARRTMELIRQNLVWAAVYNLVALPLALAGQVTPWMAGIGMSASSLLVVGNALRLTRFKVSRAKGETEPQRAVAPA